MRLRAIGCALTLWWITAAQAGDCDLMVRNQSLKMVDYKGECSAERLAHGQGIAEMEYPQSGILRYVRIEGAFQNGIPTGIGKWTSHDGDFVLEGEFRDWKPYDATGLERQGDGRIRERTYRGGQLVATRYRDDPQAAGLNLLADLLQSAISKKLGQEQQKSADRQRASDLERQQRAQQDQERQRQADANRLQADQQRQTAEWNRQAQRDRIKWQQQADQDRVRYQQQAIEQQRKDEAARAAADRAQELARREADARAQAEFKKQAAEQQTLNDRQAAAQRAEEAERLRLQAAEQQRLNEENQRRQEAWVRQNSEQQRKDEAARVQADRAQELVRREADARAQAEFKKQAAEQQAWNDRQAAAHRAAEAERLRLQAAEQQRMNAEEQRRKEAWSRQNEELQRKDEATRAAADRAQEVARREADARAQAEFKRQAAEQQRINAEEQRRKEAWARQNEEQQRKDEARRVAAGAAIHQQSRTADARVAAQAPEADAQARSNIATWDAQSKARPEAETADARALIEHQAAAAATAARQQSQAADARMADQAQQGKTTSASSEATKGRPPQVTYAVDATSPPVGYSNYGNSATVADNRGSKPSSAQQSTLAAQTSATTKSQLPAATGISARTTTAQSPANYGEVGKRLPTLPEGPNLPPATANSTPPLVQGQLSHDSKADSEQLDKVQATLSGVGIAYPPADVANAAISLARRNYKDAALDLAAIVPGPGDALDAGNIVRRTAKIGKASVARIPLVTTNAVEVSGARAIDKAVSYERAVRESYGAPAQERKFTAMLNGKIVSGEADAITLADGRKTAVDAKFVDDWATSIRNPNSPIGSQPWAKSAQEEMLTQASKYSAGFAGGVIIHTNSRELAEHYAKVFSSAGIKNFRFVITSSSK